MRQKSLAMLAMAAGLFLPLAASAVTIEEPLSYPPNNPPAIRSRSRRVWRMPR